MNILLVRPDGIGDEILCLPVAAELRRRMPAARLIFLSSTYAAPVLEHHTDLDEVLKITGRETFRELVNIFKRGFDVAVFLKPFRRLITAAWFAKVPIRVGTGYRWYSFMLNRRVYEHRKDFSKHESIYNVRLLSGLGLTADEAVNPVLFLTNDEQEWARSYLGEKKSRRILVHPCGFSSRPWKAEYFRELVFHLPSLGYEVLITGSAKEHERFITETNIRKWPEKVRNLMGKLTIRQVMAVIRESDVVISLATGPMHIAAAFGIPTVSIFDPRRNNSPTRWRPLGKGVILRPGVPTCGKCIYEKCTHWDCMDRITFTIVIEKIGSVLYKAHPVEVVDI